MNSNEISVSTTSDVPDNSTEEQPSIKNVIKEKMIKDRKIMLSCILYEVVQGKSVEDSYKSFCKVVGDDALNYPDFDYWYYRFVNGELDLDHDRSLDRRRPELSDMPLEVAESIVGKLEWKDRCSVREVCRNFRSIVDISKQHFIEIEVSMLVDISGLEIKQPLSSHKFYCQREDDVISVYIEHRFIRTTNWDSTWEPTLIGFIQISKNPKVEIDELLFTLQVLEDTREAFDILKDALSSMSHQISVKSLKLEVDSKDDVLSILPYLKPGVLERIDISDNLPNIDIDEIAELDQWKQAKEALQASPNFRRGCVCFVGACAERIRSEMRMERSTIEGDLEMEFESNTIEFEKIT